MNKEDKTKKFFEILGMICFAFLVVFLLLGFLGMVGEAYYERDHGREIELKECVTIEGSFNQSLSIYKGEVRIKHYTKEYQDGGFWICEDKKYRDKFLEENLDFEYRFLFGGKDE